MIVFTLCSNNYLAQAITLADSVLKIQPTVHFVIGLVDYLDPEIDYQKFKNVTVLQCFDLGFSEFDKMLSRYNVIEFNTAVKPYYFQYLFDTYPSEEKIYYVDPDIVFYKGFEQLDSILDSNNIVLTPMLTDPGKESQFDELVALRHGMFNLGFIGIRRSDESFRFIGWWKERLRDYCLIDKCRGIFVDQKWIDLAPLFFEGIYILKDKGYNMAWWNFNDRKLIDTKDGYFVNSEDTPLVFFHFSGFKPGSSSITGRSSESRYGYHALPELKGLGGEYEKELLRNDYSFLNQVKPTLKFYKAKNTPRSRFKNKLKSLFRLLRN
ncbi:glycosyltransferase [Algoriphagus sp. SE2]|uniref:glycosyltransferase n=1 Tax=Algoriphagus sp. SE2 TaxID=3141536 RepID=UPI0031CD0F8C